MEAVPAEMMLSQRVAPVVVIAGDDGRQMGGFEEDTMIEQVRGLPAPLPLAQAEVPVDQVQRPLRRLDDGELGAARFAQTVADRHLMMLVKRPARQDEVAVAA